MMYIGKEALPSRITLLLLLTTTITILHSLEELDGLSQ